MPFSTACQTTRLRWWPSTTPAATRVAGNLGHNSRLHAPGPSTLDGTRRPARVSKWYQPPRTPNQGTKMRRRLSGHIGILAAAIGIAGAAEPPKPAPQDLAKAKKA